MKYYFTILLSLMISAVVGQGLSDIDNLIREQNTFGFELPKHTEKIANSVFKITGIPKKGDYLPFEQLYEQVKEQPEEEMLVMFEKLNFPLVIHACEALKRKENGKWVFMGSDVFWTPYIEINDILIHPKFAFHFYQKDFKDAFNYLKTDAIKLDSIGANEAVKNLCQFLKIDKVKLDFTVESLKVLDQETEKNISKIHEDQFYLSALFYIGEIFIRTYGGKWVRKYEKGYGGFVIELNTGQLYDISSVVDFGLYDDEYPPYSAGEFYNQMPYFLKNKK